MSSSSNSLPLRAQLERDRKAVEQQLRELGVGGNGLSFDANFADTSQVTAERGEVEALVANLEEALSDIDHALAKFESDTFGKCENCENDIPSARIEAVPTARLCMACASKN